ALGPALLIGIAALKIDPATLQLEQVNALILFIELTPGCLDPAATAIGDLLAPAPTLTASIERAHPALGGRPRLTSLFGQRVDTLERRMDDVDILEKELGLMRGGDPGPAPAGPAWNRPKGTTILRVVARGHVAKDQVRASPADLLDAATIKQGRVELIGDDLGKSFTLQFKGAREWATKQVALAQSALRRADGSWRSFSCAAPSGEVANLAVHEDKNQHGRTLEFELRKELRALTAATGKRFFADKQSGTLTHDWTPVVKIGVGPDGSVELLWPWGVMGGGAVIFVNELAGRVAPAVVSHGAPVPGRIQRLHLRLPWPALDDGGGQANGDQEPPRAPDAGDLPDAGEAPPTPAACAPPGSARNHEELIIWNVHNHGLSASLSKTVTTDIIADARWSRESPRTRACFVAGDFNWSDELPLLRGQVSGEAALPRERLSGAGRAGRRWRAMAVVYTELVVVGPTHWVARARAAALQEGGQSPRIQPRALIPRHYLEHHLYADLVDKYLGAAKVAKIIRNVEIRGVPDGAHAKAVVARTLARLLHGNDFEAVSRLCKLHPWISEYVRIGLAVSRATLVDPLRFAELHSRLQRDEAQRKGAALVAEEDQEASFRKVVAGIRAESQTIANPEGIRADLSDYCGCVFSAKAPPGPGARRYLDRVNGGALVGQVDPPARHDFTMYAYQRPCGFPMFDSFNLATAICAPKGIDEHDNGDLVSWAASGVRPLSPKRAGNEIICAVLHWKWQAVVKRIAPPRQRGFVNGRNFHQNVVGLDTCGRVAGLRPSAEHPPLMLFDFAAAFPSAGWALLFMCLGALQLPAGMVNAIEMLCHRAAAVSSHGHCIRFANWAIARSPADACTKAELYATRAVPTVSCVSHCYLYRGSYAPRRRRVREESGATASGKGPPWIDHLAEASCGFPNRPHFCSHSDALLREMAEPRESDGGEKEGLQTWLDRTLTRCFMPSTIAAKFRERILKWFPMAAGAANSHGWNAHQERLMTMWARDGALDTYLGGFVILFHELPLDVAAPSAHADGKDTRTVEYAEQGPILAVPRLVEDGFVLNESHAIMSYLGDKFEWKLYPAEAGINATLKIIERWLATSRWLCGDCPTIADLSCYCEIGPCQDKFIGLFTLNGINLDSYPHIVRWLEACEKLPGYDTSHEMLRKTSPKIRK
ncbi:unnamed protein product, partial [Prorocentrum cordatum]